MKTKDYHGRSFLIAHSAHIMPPIQRAVSKGSKQTASKQSVPYVFNKCSPCVLMLPMCSNNVLRVFPIIVF